MIPILYKAVTEGTVPTNYGVGPLTDCLRAEVTEERNGSFELVLEYAAKGIHAEEIEADRFIMAKPNYTDDPQIFRIYKVSKVMNGRFTVNARHISYDLSGKVITTGSGGSCAAAVTLLDAKAGNFTISTDKSVTGSFSVTQPSSVRSWFGGKEGSLLDLYGGEWKYNNYNASLLAARGMDRGVTIRYGKNLTELSQVVDITNLVTGVVPFYIDTNGNKTIGTKVSTGLPHDVPCDVAIDFSSDVDPDSATAITTQLANLANRYIANNVLTVPNNSITLDFVQMKGLTERVDLCDTVKIYFEALGITATAKCVKTIWDVLEDRYIKTTFGSARTNIADTMAKTEKELTTTASKTDVSKATELITGNLGGYVILHDANGDGKPDEILIMNTASISTATKVWRWNKNGLGYSSNGYSGPYGTAITANGQIVADYVSTGTLNANIIKAGVISDAQGNSTIDMTNGAAVMDNFKSKTRFDLINSSNVSKGFMHINPNGDTMLWLYAASSTNPLVKIWAQDANGSGVLNLLKSNGNVIVEAGNSGYGGGGVGIRNTNDYVIGEFKEGSGHDGMLYLKDATGNDKIWALGSNGGIYCTSVTQYSSRKIKENIAPIPDADKILELDAVRFDFIDKAMGVNQRGFIAEDVAEVLPNLVTPEDEQGHPASMDYIEMIPYLQAVVKRHEEEIKELKAQLKTLTEKINKLEG